MKYCLSCLIVWLLACSVQAQDKPLTGYTYKIETGAAGKQVYISSQRPYNTNGDLIGAGDLEAQTQQVFENLKTELGKVGMALSDVKQITYRIKGVEGQVNQLASDQINTVGSLYFPKAASPKISEVKSIPQIVQNDVLVEVEVIAVK